MDKKSAYINRKGNIILALALIRHLYNKGEISEIVYKNIKKEYQKKIEST